MQDPVCGMEVNEDDAAGQSLYNGRVYLFCSESCKKKFLANPESYAKKEEKKRHTVQDATRYAPTGKRLPSKS